MGGCPIGLICEYFYCDQASCLQLVKPWPLPYSHFSIDPEWRASWGFLVRVPGYNHDYNGDWEHDEELHSYNEWIGSILQELWLGGWWEAIKIPYCPHPSGGLLVTDSLPMEQSVTLACCLDYDDELNGFDPPVPIHGYQRIYDEPPPKVTDENYRLLYASHFLFGED